MERLLIPLHENEVAPRLDLATDVLVVDVTLDKSGDPAWSDKLVVLEQASAENVCKVVLSDKVHTVICAGIEDEYMQFLTWKGVVVVDGVMGPTDTVIERYALGRLASGDNCYPGVE